MMNYQLIAFSIMIVIILFIGFGIFYIKSIKHDNNDNSDKIGTIRVVKIKGEDPILFFDADVEPSKLKNGHIYSVNIIVDKQML